MEGRLVHRLEGGSNAHQRKEEKRGSEDVVSWCRQYGNFFSLSTGVSCKYVFYNFNLKLK